MVDVLLHFRDMPDLPKFGMIGFHRLNGRNNSKRAYKRTHVVSTVLLNLSKLEGIDYHWRAHVWEDFQFNRDAELNRVPAKRAVLCKCYRFAFSSPQFRKGGCADMVARGPKTGADLDDQAESSQEPTHARASADGSASNAPPLALPEDLVPSFLKGLMTDDEVAKLGDDMRRNNLQLADLEFADLEALKQAGIENAWSRVKMLRHIRDHFKTKPQ